MKIRGWKIYMKNEKYIWKMKNIYNEKIVTISAQKSV